MAELALSCTVVVTLDAETCCKCGVAFGISSELRKKLIKTRDTFYCPSGHPQHYIGKSKEERLQEIIDSQKQRADWYEKRFNHERRSKNAIRGALTKTKNRVRNGVCPCCNRTFQDLMKHMSTKHPAYAK